MDAIILRDLHRLLAIFFVTSSLIGEVIECERRFIASYADIHSSIVGDYLSSCGVDQEIVENVRESLQVPQIFHKLNLKKLKQLIEKESPVYVCPRTYELGLVHTMARKKGTRSRKVKRVSFQYFSIRDTILSVLQKKENFEKVLSEQFSTDGVLKRDIDGSILRGKSGVLPQFQNPEDPLSPVTITMRVLLYTDEFEVTNPLGSKTLKHKINGFYFKLLNLAGTGKLKHIFVYALAKALDVKNYGYNIILEPFVQEMEEMIANGVDCHLHGRSVNVQVNFVGVTGDTLGLHEILHMLSPSCVSFCRDCLITRDTFRFRPWSVGCYRTEEHRRELFNKAKKTNRYWLYKKYGYKIRDTTLKRLNFRPRSNRKGDLMHDLFEGTSMLVIKIILNFCITKHVFTVDFLNELIKCFDYGSVNESEKPSPNFKEESLRDMKSTKLKQNACQVHLLLRALPFLIRDKLKEYYDKASEWDQYQLERLMHLLNLHMEIVRLICSREITVGQVIHLEQCVRLHNELYHEMRLENPNLPMPNKIHHLLHYGKMIKEWGPAPLFETSRFEAMHKKLKQRMRTTNNFINTPKTIADRIAINFSYEFSYDDDEPEIDLMSAKFKLSTQEYVGQAIRFRGVKYEKGQVLCLNLDDSEDKADILPVFGIIQSIHYQNDIISFIVKILETIIYDDQYCAYKVTQTNNKNSWLWSDLTFKEPMALWRNSTDDKDEEETFVPVKTANI